MSTDRPRLYSPALLARSRSPENTGPLPGATHSLRVDNPLCGDRVTLHLRVVDGTVEAASHHTRGCALCLASASVLTHTITGRPVPDVAQQAQDIVQALALDPLPHALDPSLHLFDGIRQAPARRTCVALPWQAVEKLLQ